jgi:hypothetical protein
LWVIQKETIYKTSKPGRNSNYCKGHGKLLIIREKSFGKGPTGLILSEEEEEMMMRRVSEQASMQMNE